MYSRFGTQLTFGLVEDLHIKIPWLSQLTVSSGAAKVRDRMSIFIKI